MKLEKKIAKVKAEIQRLKNDPLSKFDTIPGIGIPMNKIDTCEMILSRLRAKLADENTAKERSIKCMRIVHDDLERIIKNEKLHPETRQYLEKKRLKLFLQIHRQVPMAGKLDELGGATEKFSKDFFYSLKMVYDHTGYKRNKNTAMKFPPGGIVTKDTNGRSLNYIIVGEVAELEKNGFFKKCESIIKDQPKKRPE